MLIVIDAGPLIALFRTDEINHALSVAGFNQLINNQALVLTTFPVFCEVHKQIARYSNWQKAQLAAINLYEAIEIVPLTERAIEDALLLVAGTPKWKGTLQDASLINLARELKIKVWTLDYRDFGRFEDLEFWNPE